MTWPLLSGPTLYTLGQGKWIVQLIWGDKVNIIFSHLCLSVTNVKRTAAPSESNLYGGDASAIGHVAVWSRSSGTLLGDS